MLANFQERAISLLLPQFHQSPRLIGMMRGLSAPSQDMLALFMQVYGGFNLNTAVGDQLEKIGTLLNVDRLEREDEDYRLAIISRIVVNRSKGTGGSLIETLKILLGEIPFTIVEQFPASVQVIIYYPQSIVTEDLVKDLIPIGVKGVFFGNPYENKVIFQVGEVQPNGTIVGGSVVPDVVDVPTSSLVVADVIYT